jgi:hypothetical protein
MMYANKLAVALKVNGKVLRETRGPESAKDDTVLIPFGSEYAIYVKNMNSVRALVRIEIDGESVTDGMSLIVEANDDVEIERFVKNRNMNTGLKLKFIERTQKIEDGPRGIKTEDGLIRVEYEFEREPAKIVPSPIYQPTYISTPWPQPAVHHHHHYDKRDFLNEYKGTGDFVASNGVTYTEAQMKAPRSVLRSSSAMSKGLSDEAGGSASMAAAVQNLNNAFMSTTMGGASAAAAPEMSYSSNSASMDWMDGEMAREVKTSSGIVQPQNDKGITVGGSVSTQAFKQGAWFPTDGVKHVMVIKVLGAVGEKAVTKPVTVKTKVECPTCGTKNKFGTKFCRECGTGLVQVD